MVNKRGGIVAIEPKTGEILALVTAPSYDPAILVGRQRSKIIQCFITTLSPNHFMTEDY
jgi:cell division protein FtsI/penicillin-binding protein 2